MSVKSLDKYIAITPGIAGGRPYIAGHRVTVQNIAFWHERLDKHRLEYRLVYSYRTHEQNLLLYICENHKFQ